MAHIEYLNRAESQLFEYFRDAKVKAVEEINVEFLLTVKRPKRRSGCAKPCKTIADSSVTTVHSQCNIVARFYTT